MPGQSLIFYSLRGKYDSTNGQIEFVKIYENHHETEGYEVEYKGVLEGDGTMRGKWHNKKGGSFGKFICRRQVLKIETKIERNSGEVSSNRVRLERL